MTSTTTKLDITVKGVAGVTRIIRRVQALGDAGHMPARTRKRLLTMAGNGGLWQSRLRPGRERFTLDVTPSYELNRILGRLEARAEKAAA